MQRELIVLFTVASFVALSAGEIPIKGYYWRDFEGVIPKDALEGGLDRAGFPIYIGQVLFDAKIVPGKIYGHDRQIRYAWDNEKLEKANVKILCSQTPEMFSWIQTSHDGASKLAKEFLVKGGYQPGHYSYVGRAFQSGETVIGKVICQDTDCLGFYSPLDGKQVIDRNIFEVLSYTPSS